MAYRKRWILRTNEWIPSESQWERGMSLIPKVEQERIMRFRRPTKEGMFVGRFNSSAKDSLVGRLLLRACVEECFGNLNVEWKRTEEGKPYAQMDVAVPNFNMNVSHDGHCVVFVSDGLASIGVDVMEITLRNNTESLDDFFSLMEICFTDKEWSVIRLGSTDHEKLKRFYVHWTLKESYIKTVGIGLGFELKRAEFTLNDVSDPTSAILHIDGLRMDHWKFEIHDLDNYIVSIAYGHPDEILESHKPLIHKFDEACQQFNLDQLSRCEFQKLDVESLLNSS